MGKQLDFISLKLNQKIEPHICEDSENDVEYYHDEELGNSQLPFIFAKQFTTTLNLKKNDIYFTTLY